jgi:hypothetical protein
LPPIAAIFFDFTGQGMEIVLMKGAGNVLVPADEESAEQVAKLKLGQGMKVKLTQARNLKFHQKFFCLLNYAFDAWEPTERKYQGIIVKKEKKRFRGDIIVLAGHYNTSLDMNGEVRLTPKSISFAKMNQETFDAMYSSVIDVILRRILTNYSKDDLENTINKILSFT